MHRNGHTIRYVARHEAEALSPHLDEFVSVRAAQEHLGGRLAQPGDTLTLWECHPFDSSGEAYSRMVGEPKYVLTVGKRGGIRTTGRGTRP